MISFRTFHPVEMGFHGPGGGSALTLSLNSKTFRGEDVVVGTGYVFITDAFVTEGSYNPYPVPVASDLQGGTIGTAYSETISAQGGTPSYVFSVTSGGLPTGCTLNSATGVISGTPTATGVFSFTIKVLDADGNTGTQPFSITIGVPPVASSPTNYCFVN